VQRTINYYIFVAKMRCHKVNCQKMRKNLWN